MTLQQIIDLVTQLQAQLVALQTSTTAFTQADLDAAVLKAKADQASLDAVAQAALQATIDSLTKQVAALQSQVDGIGAIVGGAVGAENVRVLGIVKGLLDGEEAAILAAMVLPVVPPVPKP
jgi:hypothetical protein